MTLDNLRRGEPTVVVNSEGLEYLLLPHARPGVRGFADRLFRRRWVEVFWRHGDRTHGGFEVSVSRDMLRHVEPESQLA